MSTQLENSQLNHVAQDVQAIISRYPDPTGRLINVLNDIQERYRFLPGEALDEVSQQLEIERNQLDRMAIFFDYLSLDPVGRSIIDVCDGTACHTQGAPRLTKELERLLGIKAGETTPDGNITLRTVACIGACGLAPAIVIDGEAYGRIRVQNIPSLVTIAETNAQDSLAHEQSEASHE